MRVLIVDDEQPARRDIRRMLEKIDGVEVVGEGGNGIEAVELVQALTPDLILLDVQMPGLDGFQVIARLTSKMEMPPVIFITAYDQYALRAFEVHATDYLLKPVDEERLAGAVGRARLAVEAGGGGQDFDALLSTFGRLSRRMALRTGETVVMVDIGDILYATIIDGDVIVTTGEVEGRAGTRSLEEFQRELGDEAFMKVHRSYIANLGRIHEISPGTGGGLRLRMGGASGPVIPSSRSHARKLRRLFKL